MRRWTLPCLVVPLAVIPFVIPQAAIATTEWSVVPTPNASDISQAVSCATSSACAAVGSLTTIQGATHPQPGIEQRPARGVLHRGNFLHGRRL
jgi:hypothetical protein